MKPFEEGQEERIRHAVSGAIDDYAKSTTDPAFAGMISVPEYRDHATNIGTSILCTKWEIGYPGGSFVQAVVNNNLMETFGRADHINLYFIRFYVYLIYNQGYVA